ncbi:hypothetical protein LAN31_23875, partial [Mycobacterium tuberculosis]|nr:hypothetical protein [Mycobacterium tuberculosis]
FPRVVHDLQHGRLVAHVERPADRLPAVPFEPLRATPPPRFVSPARSRYGSSACTTWPSRPVSHDSRAFARAYAR